MSLPETPEHLRAELEQLRAHITRLEARIAHGSPISTHTPLELSSRPCDDQMLKQAAQRAQMLSVATHAFATATTDYPALLALIGELIGEQLATAVIIRVMADDPQWLQAVTIAAPDPVVRTNLQAVVAHAPIHMNEPNLAAVAARTNQPLLIAEITPEVIHTAIAPEEWASFEPVYLRSAMLVPLQAQGQQLGILSLMRYGADQPMLTEANLAHAQDLAHCAALAIHSTRLHNEALAEQVRRKAVEGSLQAREGWLRLRYEAAGLGVWQLDPVTKRIDCDARARAHYSIDTDETTLDTVLARIHPDDRLRYAAEIMAPSEGSVIPEFRIIHPDGAIHWLAVQTHRIAADAGLAQHPGQVFGISHDITQHKRDTSALHESKARFALAFQASPVAFAISEAATGQFIEVNATFVRLMDSTEADLIGQTSVALGIFVDPAERTIMQGEMAAHGSIHERPVQIRTQKGEIRQVVVSITPIDLDDIACYFTVMTDITDRLRAEQALAAEHRHVLRLKNAFIATMSHELRTPLSAVLGSADLLIDGTYGALQAPQASAVQRIAQSGRNLLAMINDVLDYAKFEAGQIAIAREPMPVADLCDATIRLVAAMAQEKQIVPMVMLDQEVTLIMADGRRLQQILLNLLTNAIKFTPTGGEVGLEVHGDRAQAQVTFTVWDTGIGIAAADLARLFQPFSQIDNRLSRRYEGTGLGLALVHQLVDAHGGGITVDSTPGAGSRFSVILPWDGNPDRADTVETLPQGTAMAAADNFINWRRPTPPAPTAPLILIVDDQGSNRVRLQDMLASYGYRTTAVADGASCLQVAREHPPSVILMDIQLPGMSGIEATQQIRADAALSATPIIALSAIATPDDRERCLTSGASDYLAKPVRAQTLSTAIERQLAPHEAAR